MPAWSYRSPDVYYYRAPFGMFSAVRDGRGWCLEFRSTDRRLWALSYAPHHTKTIRGAMRRIESILKHEEHEMTKKTAEAATPTFAETALLVALNIKTFGAQKSEKDKNAQVSEKMLEPVTKAVSALRTFHYDNTLPWLDEGTRILPSANYESYKAEMEKHKDGFDAAVRGFCDRWPEVILDAQARLGNKFKADDYPVDIRERFSVSVKFSALPEANAAAPAGIGEDETAPVAAAEGQQTADDVAARMGEFMSER